MSRPARVVINLSALRQNLNRVRTLAPRARVMAIIKTDAYGHGITRVARALASADAFGVACLEEARQLRGSGIVQPVVLLEGAYAAAELQEIVQLELDMVVHDRFQVEMLESARPEKPINVWLKVDTGMHRLGVLPGEFNESWQRLQECRSVAQQVRLMTHLATASERAHPMTRMQLDCFRQLCGHLPVEKSIANSAGITAFPESHADWVRPGLMLYGVSPLSDSTAAEEGLVPVMSLQSELIAIKQLCTGEPVGYGATWHCPEDMPVGVVAAGYGDGYPRHAPSGTPVLLNGARVNLIGRASMDMLIVDLRAQPDARIGDPVVLWGDGLPVEEVARHADTIPYEILCGVHKRLQFIDHGEG
ncbi:MAG: alanine racemase [Gammaproteobacteria bacterium]